MKDIEEHLKLARALSKLLDSQFSIFGFHFGLDPVFDLIPAIGTLVPTFLSLYVVWIGYTCGLPRILIARMIFNCLVDGTIGSVPIIGTIADAVFKANEKNMKIIDTYRDHHPIILHTR